MGEESHATIAEALDLIRSVLKADPNSARGYQLLFQMTDTMWHRRPTPKPQPVAAFQVMRTLRQWDALLAEVQRRYPNDPANDELLALLAEALVTQRHYHAAIEVLQRWTTRQPTNLEARKWLELATLGQSALSAAHAPVEALVRLATGKVLMQQRKHAEAVRELLALSKDTPHQTEATLLLGRCYLELHQPNLALECFERVLLDANATKPMLEEAFRWRRKLRHGDTSLSGRSQPVS